jgi:hypothetical protein
MITITIRVQSTCESVIFAADELTAEFSKVDGLQLTLSDRNDSPDKQILIGTYEELGITHSGIDVKTKKTETVGYRLVNTEGRLGGYVAGDSPRSVVLAVYRLLRELGWRWPDPYTERIPDLSAIESACPIDATFTPTYKHRGICIEGSVSEDHVKAIINWAPKAGFNGYFVQFREGHTFFDRWYAQKIGRHLRRDEAVEILDRIIPEITKRSLDYHAVGHGWTCEPFGIPGLGWVIHKDPISKEVSQYFAEIDGVRELFGGIALNTNLCFSSDEVQRRMAEAVADYAEAHEEIDYIHVWIGDGTNNNCECPSCVRARPSDFYVQILNRIDSLLSKRRLDTKIVFLAYVDLFWPPERERLENQDRFVLMFAPITRSYSSSFATEKALPELPPYRRNRLEFPKSVEGNLAFLAAWQEIFSGDGFDFDYHMMWDHYTDPGYTHIANVLYEDIVRLDSIGLSGYMSCQVQRAFFPTGLCMYVMGEALWNAEKPYTESVDEYFTAAYGERGTWVYEYLTRITKLFSPEYLRGERNESSDIAAIRFEEAKQYLVENTNEIESIGGTEGHLLKAHNQLLIILAEALALRAQEKPTAAVERWNDAVRLVRGFDPEITNRFDEYMFQRVIGGRLFGVDVDVD